VHKTLPLKGENSLKHGEDKRGAVDTSFGGRWSKSVKLKKKKGKGKNIQPDNHAP